MKTKKKQPRRSGPAPKYTWDSWFKLLSKLKGSTTWLSFSKNDYDCGPSTFASYFRLRGRKRGTPVTVHIDDDEVLVRLK